jgi:hypothetical protein
MTPQELAQLHPCLYHVAAEGALGSIWKMGLLPTAELLQKFDVGHQQFQTLTQSRRANAVKITHAKFGDVEINDNVPLTESALSKCLDDNLAPADWLQMLNKRVFFFPEEDSARSLSRARLNLHRKKTVVVVDTLRLAESYAENMEICPINSGSTIRKPARRGLATFSPLLKYSYSEWRGLRGQRDQIKEVIVTCGIPDVKNFAIDAFEVQAGATLRRLL